MTQRLSNLSREDVVMIVIIYAPVVNQTEIYPIPTSAFVMIKIDEPHTAWQWQIDMGEIAIVWRRE